MLSIKLLGEFKVDFNGQPIVLVPRVARLLTYMILYPQEQSRSSVAQVFWPDAPMSQDTLLTLRGHVTRLRKTLGETNKTQKRVLGYTTLELRLQPGDAVDMLGIEQLNVEKADLKDLVQCANGYGNPADVISDLFPLWRVERLVRRQGQILEAIAERSRSQGDMRASLHWNDSWITHDPNNEDAYICRMKIFAALGNESGVLESYELCEHNKQLPASRRLRKIHDDCIAQARNIIDMGLLPRNNLPHYDTLLVGRAAELKQLTELLCNADTPIVSVIGFGGMGKTRLATEAGKKVLRMFPDGVFFTRVGGSEDANSLSQYIAEAIEFSFHSQGTQFAQLCDFLRDKRMLIILDGLESILSIKNHHNVVRWLDQIVDLAPNLRLLVTSRQRLLSSHERGLDLMGLAVPDQIDDPQAAHSEAVELFYKLAERRYDGALLLQDVVSICQLVQGMPLAIELAVPWVRVKSCAEIAAGIRRELDIKPLTVDENLDPQHGSLRASFEYSWKQLDVTERLLFMKLSLFESGFSSVAAETVADASGSLLLALADRSFIRREPAGQFRIHDLVRQYGYEKIKAAPNDLQVASEMRLVDYYVAFVQAYRDTAHVGFEAFNNEWTNLLASIRLAHEHQNWESVIAIVDALIEAWDVRSRYVEALAGHAFAVEAASKLSRRPMLLRSLRWQGRMLLEQGQYAEANRLYDHALALALDEEDEKEIAWVYHDQAWQAMEQSRGDDADRLLAMSIDILEEYGHHDELPPILLLLARRCVDRGDLDQAERAAERARVQLEKSGTSLHDLANAYRWLSDIALRRENWSRSHEFLDKALHISSSINDEFTIAACHYTLARLYCLSGEKYEEGLEFAQRAYQAFTRLGVRKSIAQTLYWLGILHWKLAALDQARKSLQDSFLLIVALGDKIPAVNIELGLGDVCAALKDDISACEHWRHAFASAQELRHPLLNDLEERLHKCL